jgi:hypothetical protein
MYELNYNGDTVGVFSTEEEAKKYANHKGFGTFSIFPLGTFVTTDDWRDYPENKNSQNDDCKHIWIDATNEIVSGTLYCSKCGKLKPMEGE